MIFFLEICNYMGLKYCYLISVFAWTTISHWRYILTLNLYLFCHSICEFNFVSSLLMKPERQHFGLSLSIRHQNLWKTAAMCTDTKLISTRLGFMILK